MDGLWSFQLKACPGLGAIASAGRSDITRAENQPTSPAGPPVLGFPLPVCGGVMWDWGLWFEVWFGLLFGFALFGCGAVRLWFWFEFELLFALAFGWGAGRF